MTYKNLRILLADNSHANLLYIEREFNRLGYYRIATVQSFSEALLLVSGPLKLIDLFIFDYNLAKHNSQYINIMTQDKFQTKHSIAYNSAPPEIVSTRNKSPKKVHIAFPHLPEITLVTKIIDLADDTTDSPNSDLNTIRLSNLARFLKDY